MDQLEPQLTEPVTFTAEEIAGIEEALADFEANGSVPYEEVKAWLDSLDTASPLPEPQPRKY
jgi:predicted transcriptional regulator